MTQEQKRASLENELKQIQAGSTVEITGNGFKANHRGYEVQIDDNYRASIKEPFVAEEWDKTATPEECFVWGSNVKGEQGYNTIVGYNASLQNYTDVKIPSRCVKFGATYATGDYKEVSGKEYASNIGKLEFPNTMKVIGGTNPGADNGFGFSALKKVVIPDSVLEIGSNAFSYCNQLENITISNNLIKMGYGVFDNTKWYNSQPDGVVYLGNVLYGYKGTMLDNTSIQIKEGTSVIATYAFRYNGRNLVGVIIPDSVISIGSNAFNGCENLNEIELPNNIVNVGYSAFSGTGWWNNQPDGVVYIGNVLYTYKGTMPENASIEVKEGTKAIAEYAFRDYYTNSTNKLASISIPDSVISIGTDAFFGCKNLSNVEMSKNVKYMGDAVFSGCTKLENIVIWENVELLGCRNFDNWTGTQNVNFKTDKISASWNDAWKYGCNANIVFAYSGIE